MLPTFVLLFRKDDVFVWFISSNFHGVADVQLLFGFQRVVGSNSQSMNGVYMIY